jgi:hypothetical protein
MNSAEVTFSRVGETIEMVLWVGGLEVASSVKQEDIVIELQIRAIHFLSIEARFSTELPTSEKTLTLASSAYFSQPLAAMKLIDACSSMG